MKPNDLKSYAVDMTRPKRDILNELYAARQELFNYNILTQASIDQMNQNQETIDKLNKTIREYCTPPPPHKPAVGSIPFKFNNVLIGEFYKETDGFYVFEPLLKPGCWNEHLLMHVMYKLRTLNAAWDLQIMTDPKVSSLGVENAD